MWLRSSVLSPKGHKSSSYKTSLAAPSQQFLIGQIKVQEVCSKMYLFLSLLFSDEWYVKYESMLNGQNLLLETHRKLIPRVYSHIVQFTIIVSVLFENVINQLIIKLQNIPY